MVPLTTCSTLAARLLAACGFATMAGAVAALDPLPHDAQPRGGLSGASIFVSAGHGWYYNTDRQKWVLQRGVSHGVLEDHSNAETVNQYLLPYLWNAGAGVYPVRERCMNPNMVVVDRGDEGYREDGRWETEANPVAHGAEQRRTRTTRNTVTATASFTPTIPAAGIYGVYVKYDAATAGKTTASARFIVRHTGGQSVWVQDLNRDGKTWKYIGSYHFAAGASTEAGSVLVNNQTDKAGDWIVVDAVRFGGGMGDITRADTTSGAPRWEESGELYAEFMGMTNHAQDSRPYNQVSAMPMYAEWEAEPWEHGRSVYISWHSNASGSSSKARGLFSFIYSPDEWKKGDCFTGHRGGDLLGAAMHQGVIDQVHGAWDPEWRDGGVICRWLGEVNPRNNNSMPAALVEVGFFDEPNDAGYILDPTFRRRSAYGVYRGLLDYYRQNVPGFENARALPDTPTHLTLVQDGQGFLVTWDAPPSGTSTTGDAPTHYLVQRSRDGRGFETGYKTTTTSARLEGLPPGDTTFVRIVAVNEGGHSLPTEVLAVRMAQAATRRVLIVNAFDRLDRGLNTIEPNGAERGILDRMNAGNYIVQYAEAIARSTNAFDSASNESVADGRVNLANYRVVVWAAGRESTGTATINELERAVLDAYLAGGGRLILSGTDIAMDLDKQGTDAQSFLASWAGAGFVADDAGTFALRAAPDSPFVGLGQFALDDGTAGIYRAAGGDVLDTRLGGRPMMEWLGADGRAQVAATYKETSARVLTTAFPIECLVDVEQRAEFLARAFELVDPTEHLRP